MEKVDKRIGIVFLLLIVFTSIIVFYVEKDYQPIKIDLFVNDYVSNLIKDNGTICTQENINLEYGQKIFGPQTSIINDEGCLLPSYPLGYPIVLTLSKIVFYPLFKYINILFYLTSLFFVYKISRIFFNKKSSFIATLSVGLFAPMIFFTTLTFNTLCAISFYLMSVYYFIKANKNGQKIYFFLFGLTAGIHMWVRFYDFIYYFPLIFLIKKAEIKKIWISVLAFMFFFIPLLYLSLSLYGNPMGMLGLLSQNSIMTPKEAYVNILGYEPGFFGGWELFKENFVNYFVLFLPILFIFFIYGLQKIKGYKKQFFNKFFLFAISLIIITFLFFSLGAFQGFEHQKPIVDSSYNRYFLPAYIFMIIFFVITLTYTKRFGKRMVCLMFSLFIVSNILLLSSSFSGLVDLKAKQEAFSAKQEVFNLIPDNSFLLTKYTDPFVFPRVHIVYYYKFTKENRTQGALRVVEYLLDKGQRVYFANDDYWMQDSPENYFKAFESRGIEITKINNYYWEISNKN